MTNLNKFALAVNWYIQDLNKCSGKEQKDKYLKFQDKIQNLECNDFRYYFHRANHFNSKNILAEAKYNIDKSISLLKKVEINGVGEYLFAPLANNLGYSLVTLPPINSQLADVYSLAGEIYAKLEEEQISLKYHQIAMYHKSFLKTEFDKQNEIFLFSFRKFNEYTLSDLINNEITVSPSKKMNDPFDSIINLWADANKNATNSADRKIIAPLLNSFDNYRIRAFCFGKGNSPIKKVLMWSHYAGEHTGFCIKYKLSKHFICQEKNQRYEHMYLKKIAYTNKKINLLTPKINSDLAFATKNINWKYEKEVRLIVYNPNKRELFYGIKLDSLSKIDTIFFGYRCPDSTINTIKNLFIEKHTETPKFYKMILDEKNIYNLKYIQI